MKRYLLFGTALIVLALMLFNRNTLLYKFHTSTFEEISSEEFYDLAAQAEDEEYFVYFGRGTCPYCRDFVPDLKWAAKESNTTIYYVDTENTATDPELKALRNHVGVELVPSLVKIDSKHNVLELLDITNRQKDDLLLHFR